MAKSNFEKVSESIQKKSGYGEERADAIAAAIGRKKYGAAGMAKKAKIGIRKAKKGG